MGTDFTSEGTVLRVVTTVLCTDTNILTELTQTQSDVDVGDAQNDVDIGWDRPSLVHNLDPFHVLIVTAIAFPISTDQITAGTWCGIFNG